MRELPPHCFPSQRSRWHQAVAGSIDRVGRSPDLRGNMTAGGPSARFTPRHGMPTPDTPSSAGARLINSSGRARSTRGLTVEAYRATGRERLGQGRSRFFCTPASPFFLQGEGFGTLRHLAMALASNVCGHVVQKFVVHVPRNTHKLLATTASYGQLW